MKLQPIEILLVENNPEQVQMTREALRKGKVLNSIQVVSDGFLAMEYLAQSHGKDTLPHCIMLDAPPPDHENRPSLETLRTTLDYAHIPVIILVAKDDENPYSNQLDFGTHYIARKPLDVKQLLSIARAFDNFFISVVTERSKFLTEYEN